MGKFNRQLGLCFSLLFLYSSAPLVAQQGELDFFAINQGLSSPVITDIIRDKQGYLWMGTLDGLNRFDGYQFRTFNQGPYSNTKLSSGNISQLSLDQENKLIIAYQNSPGYFDRFDPITFEVERVQLLARDDARGHPKIVATDQLGRTFIVYTSQEGVNVYEYTPAELKLVIETKAPLNRYATSVELLILDNTEFLLFDQFYGLRHFSAAGELRYQYLPENEAFLNEGSWNFERPAVMLEGSDQQVYFSFYNRKGLYVYDYASPGAMQALTTIPQDQLYTAGWRDSKGQLLLSVRKDNPLLDQVDHFYLIDQEQQIEVVDELLAAGQRVYSAVGEDFKHTVHLGTFSGLAVFKFPRQGISSYLTDDQDEEVFSSLIRGITEDADGNIYFLSQDEGLFKINANTRALDSIPLLSPEDGDKLIFKDAGKLVFGRDSALYFTATAPGGSQEGWLIRYDPISCIYNIIKSDWPINSLCLGPEASIFIGSRQRGGKAQILQFEEGSQSLVPMSDASGSNFLPNTEILHLSLSLDEEELFIGTSEEGLLIYNLLNRTVKHFAPPLVATENVPVPFNDYNIYHVLEEKDGRLWIATRGGLHLLSQSRTKVDQHISRVQGLSSNVICGILPVSAGKYWLSTFYGLTYYDTTADPPFLRYYRTDGLTNNEFNRFSFYRDKEGRNYFGGVNGLNVFFDEELLQPQEPAQVVITQINCYGRGGSRVIETELDELDQLLVNRDEKGLAVQFAMPATAQANRNRFRVKLEGQHKDWVELGSDHTARYNNLGAGRYRLLVQGSDANGNYAKNDLVLPILVKQYIWERSWFLILLGLTAAASVIGFLYYRLQDRLRAEKLRTQLSSDIHDEVSGLLAGITMQSELLQGHTEDDHLQNRLKGVGEAGRKAMSKLSDVIWSIDSRRDTIGELFQRMQEHADDVLLPLDIRYRFQFDGQFDRGKTMSGDIRQDLYFIYKEAINNIARHSNGNKVKIILSQVNNRFEMLIEDNGNLGPTNGLDANRSIRSGQGLANLRMRANRLRAKLDINTDAGYRILLNMKKL